ncbi:MAG: phage capsid protein [Flavobacteriales bacterium]|jgi:hypothetical protein|nr:phage capsid protein [Flavobacteriales bacterium]|tara:strand:- start:1725 stop:2612 length:888 start_codon:yes stop_codon:yes gene_type:complete
MANDNIDKALIIQFSDQLRHESQQIRARLRPYVQVKPMIGDLFAYDGLGDVEAREVSGRVQATVFDDIDHLRRKITRRRFAVTLPIDKMDDLGVLIEPQSEYAIACIKAMERVFDRVGVDALFATVSTGRDFETDVTFASDGAFTVTATSGIEYDDLLTIHQNWIDADVGNDIEEAMVFAISGDEHTALMKESELISGDFTRNFVVEKGSMVQAAGLNLIKFAANARVPVLPVSGGVRDCFAITSRGLCYGLSQDMEITIKDRPDLVNVNQVQITGILGAVRTEGVHVQKVQTTD